MIGLQDPPRNGEGDRAKRGGGGSAKLQRPIVYTARRLRREMSLPEVLLWQQLRQRPGGLKFRRQRAIDPHVADFFCCSARISIEIDGSAHDSLEAAKCDEARDHRFEARGTRVLRIPATEILDDPVRVANWIAEQAATPLHQPMAGPPPRAGEDLSAEGQE